MPISKEWIEELMERSTPDGKVVLKIVYNKHVQRARGNSGISKAWLTDLMRTESIPERKMMLDTVFDKLTESSNKSEKKPKKIDHNKVYENILLYYINHGKTPEEAHIIARGIVEDQKEKQKRIDNETTV